MTAPNFFSSGSPYLDHPLLTPERTASEVDYVLTQGAFLAGARVLDVGCGPGRHSLELARRGYRVVGIDPSPTMIAAAVDAAGHMDLDPAPEFIRVGGEEFRSAPSFEAAICLFTTLGQMDESGDNAGLLEAVFAALSPGGVLIVEVPNRDWVAANLKVNDRFGGTDEYTAVERHFEPRTNTVTETFNLVSPAERRTFMLRYRVYTVDELRGLLETSGYEVSHFHGSYAAKPFEGRDPIILAVARKP
jgi:D-alanine-D-alanine ligase